MTAHSIRIGNRTGNEVANPATSKLERTDHDEYDRNLQPPDASRLYVKKISDDKSRWDEIGAAWAHQDGKGFSVKLDYLPLNGAEIVIREPKAKNVVQVGA